MESAARITAWVTIFSILFTGCYSSALIDPAGKEKQDLASQRIEYVVTKDGKAHVFDAPATVDSIEVSGIVKGQRVSYPWSDIYRVGTSDFDVAMTIIAAIGIAGLCTAVFFGISEWVKTIDLAGTPRQ